MCTQNLKLFSAMLGFEPEGILHIARWVIGRHIEYVEVVVFALKFGSKSNIKSQPTHYEFYVALGYCQRMQVADFSLCFHDHYDSVFCPGCHSTGQSLPVWRALTTLSVSSTLRPTSLSEIVMWRSTPLGSIINVPLYATPSSVLCTP